MLPMKGAIMNHPITQEYIALFQAITKASEELETVRAQLLQAQLLGEELYIENTAEAE